MPANTLLSVAMYSMCHSPVCLHTVLFRFARCLEQNIRKNNII